jgi:hypothetical protein
MISRGNGNGREGGWLTAYIPPFAMRLRRMGHPGVVGGLEKKSDGNSESNG